MSKGLNDHAHSCDECALVECVLVGMVGKPYELFLLTGSQNFFYSLGYLPTYIRFQ